MCIRLPWQRCCVPRSISDSIHPHVPCLHDFASYPFVNPNNVRINPHLANARPQLQKSEMGLSKFEHIIHVVDLVNRFDSEL
ncbi:hypothetical protein AT1G04895 [Arabidopsis thaliana]|uniref:Uncharacterized protein n=2 Tax=Arabidopsis thaliana TaxID=3702 RepID=A0A1P8AN26_ARATH|nr:uncharacterized protein AT1G04895 [Arabidopsis thaliana]ANM58056.1 hypothetical protein AT1G04895 [Arabidopsis thaliana]CAA0165690.1 unnamed protein product [Arabidopsis thaliana]|eukprot:NP_001320520.1 hypothetical protein AT1G04895 [Arabidopsis thaliana]